MSPLIKVAIEAGVLEIRFARPEKKNALTDEMYRVIADALEGAEDARDVRAVLFTAEGDSFTAGNDIADFARVASDPMAISGMQVLRFLKALAKAEKPIVAGVQGGAVGVGLTMLLHCDLVYVAETALLSAPFANLALVPEAASSYLLPRRIGHARAFALFGLGEPITGAQAASLGLANAALPADQVEFVARGAARALAQKPLGALIATKKLMRDAAKLTNAMKRENAAFAKRLQSAEAQEAFAAFLERRPADFTKLS